jgi:hypothetical protein
MAIIALVCSIGGIATVVSAPVGIVLAYIAKKQIAETGEEGGGIATAALIIGYIITGIALAVCCGFALLTVFAISSAN